MSNSIEQNGRQLSTEQAAPPTDPRTRGLRAVPPTPESQRICRDFVWGICSMNEHCKYRHELEYESMRSILKFCHDYQNRTGCTRPECTYLHASRDEENLFLTSGVIPRVLVERYASMSGPSDPAPEPVPQMMYMNEFVGQPPPPPPPPSAQGSAPAPPAPIPGPSALCPQIMPHMSGPMGPGMTQMPMCNVMPASMPNGRPMEQPSHPQLPLTVKTNMHAVMPSISVPVSAPMPSILAPPPPPPPPTIAAAPTQMAPPVYTVAQPLQHAAPSIYVTPCPQQHLQQPQPSTSQFTIPVLFDPSRPPPPLPKRPAPTEPEAGPSKVLKLDDEIDSLCDSCIEQNLRIALYQQEIEKLQREEEYRRRIYEQKTEEYENGNVLLRSLLSPQMFRVVDEFLDVNAPTSDIFASSSSPTYSSNSATTVPKQFLFQLMEFLLNKRNSDQLTSPLELLTRRSTSQTELMVASMLELLQNGVSSESRITTALDTIGSNGLGRLASNGPLELPPAAARYSQPAPRYTAATVPYAPPNGEVLPPAAPYQAEPAPGPAVYVPYQAAPAPPRPFYQPYGNGAAAPGPAPAPAPPPPAQPYPSSSQPYPAPYHVPRMPHYYPPFQ